MPQRATSCAGLLAGLGATAPAAGSVSVGDGPSAVPGTQLWASTYTDQATSVAASPAGGTVFVTAYVASRAARTVTPIRAATGKPGKPIRVGKFPYAIAITPDGKTACVVNRASGTVTPIRTATGTAGKAIKVGDGPRAIAITPDGKTAYVVDRFGGYVKPVSTATGTAGKRIHVGDTPVAIAITPDGKTAYVSDQLSDTVTPISTATNTAGPAIPVGQGGAEPGAIAITPDGKTAYVVSPGVAGTVTPIRTSALPPTPRFKPSTSGAAQAIAITP